MLWTASENDVLSTSNLTPVMTNIVFDKSTDHTKPLSIFLLPQY